MGHFACLRKNVSAIFSDFCHIRDYNLEKSKRIFGKNLRASFLCSVSILLYYACNFSRSFLLNFACCGFSSDLTGDVRRDVAWKCLLLRWSLN